MPGRVVPGILIVASGTWLSKVGTKLILATLTGMIFVACPGDGIEMRAGYAVDRCGYSGAVRLPVGMDLVAEPVELLDALSVGANGALSAWRAELEKS